MCNVPCEICGDYDECLIHAKQDEIKLEYCGCLNCKYEQQKADEKPCIECNHNFNMFEPKSSK